MNCEEILTALKGISSILVLMCEMQSYEINWMCWGIDLLNRRLIKCIEALEHRMN